MLRYESVTVLCSVLQSLLKDPPAASSGLMAVLRRGFKRCVTSILQGTASWDASVKPNNFVPCCTVWMSEAVWSGSSERGFSAV